MPSNLISRLRFFQLLVGLSLFCFKYLIVGSETSSSFEVPNKMESLLSEYCYSCHDVESEKGDVRLNNLNELSLIARIEILNRVHEQLYIREMPPEKKRTQPSNQERQQLIEWVGAELNQHGGSRLDDKLRYPDCGNYVDHDLLFSGKIQEPAFTPSRRWLVSPQIFEERVRDVFQLEGRHLRPFPLRTDTRTITPRSTTCSPLPESSDMGEWKIKTSRDWMTLNSGITRWNNPSISPTEKDC